MFTGCNGDDQDYAAMRQQMVARQIEGRDVKDAAVLRAMRKVPRHLFVAKEMQPMAYMDRPLPIGYGQTISQPYIVAYMTEILELKPQDRVLEVGTGSGYQAAVLGEIVAEVYSIEIVEPLGKEAAQTIADLGYKNVILSIGDGYQGIPESAPFDAIIVTAAPSRIPQPLIEQLAEGGFMIIPVGGSYAQELILLEKKDGKLIEKAVLPVRFVPLTKPNGRNY